MCSGRNLLQDVPPVKLHYVTLLYMYSLVHSNILQPSVWHDS